MYTVIAPSNDHSIYGRKNILDYVMCFCKSLGKTIKLSFTVVYQFFRFLVFFAKQSQCFISVNQPHRCHLRPSSRRMQDSSW